MPGLAPPSTSWLQDNHEVLNDRMGVKPGSTADEGGFKGVICLEVREVESINY